MYGRRSIFAISAAICVISFCLCVGQAPAAAPKEKEVLKDNLKDVIVLHQTSTTFGKCDLYLSPDAARFYGRNGDIIVMTKAPTWEMILYCKSKNQGYEFNQNTASHNKLGVFTSPMGIQSNRMTKYSDKDLHVEAGKVVVSAGSGNVQHDVFIFQDRKKRTIKDSTTEIWQPFAMVKPLQTFINWTYSFGAYAGIPLDVTAHYADGNAEHLYHTVAIEHVRKPEAFFDYVTKFKKVPDVIKVLVSEDINTTLEDLLGDTPNKHK